MEPNVSCRNNLNDCPPSDTANIVTEFSNNNNAFHDAFGEAFQILVENGYPLNILSIAVADNNNTMMNGTDPTDSTMGTSEPDSAVQPMSGLFVLIIAFIFMNLFILV